MRKLYDWMMRAASDKRAPYALGTVSFVESSFFPIPPDVMLVPMILARRLTLNPVAVITALLLWGWMWGVVGLLLAVPILVIIKIVFDQIEPLKPIGDFLGG